MLRDYVNPVDEVPDATPPAPVSDREAARQKRIADREAAKIEHAKFLAKEALAQPEKDRKREEWIEAEKVRNRAINTAKARKYYASHKKNSSPDKPP